MTIPRTMPAIWYELTGPARDVLVSGERPTPRPGPGDVLVKVVASAVNPHDTKRRSGWVGGAMEAPVTIPHSDGAGTIVAVGAGVEEKRVGEDVWLFRCGGPDRPGEGSLAGFVAVPSRQAVPLPSGFDHAAGATLGVPGMTAHYAVFCDGPVTGKTVLVAGGAGAVAGYAIQLAKWDGARVIATVSSAEKAAVATGFGADQVIDYTRESVCARVPELVGAGGVERIVEVDFGANVATDVAIIAPNGVIASYSSTRVREPVLPYYPLQWKGVRLHFVQGMILTDAAREAAIRDLSAGIGAGRIVAPRLHRFAFADAAQAHEWQESGTGIGKAVVMIEDRPRS